MSESIDPLEERPFEAPKEYNLSDRVAGKSQVEQNMAPQAQERKNSQKSAQSAATSPNAPSTYHLWDERRKLGIMFGRVYLKIMVVFLGVLSIYWGALYRREDRVGHMKYLVVIEDNSVQLTNSSTVAAPLGPAFVRMLDASAEYGHFVYANVLELAASALSNNRTTYDELARKIHLQKYWAGLYINRTASQQAYDLLVLANALSVYAAEVPYLVTVVYESGRHYSALSQYVTKNVRLMEIEWLSSFALGAYADMVRNYLTSGQRRALITASNSTEIPSALSVLPSFNMVDMRPALSAAVLGPSELGLVYAQIFSFHQFNFSVDLHNSIKDKLRFRHYVWYRIMFSQINHFVLALVYALMTIAFQVPIDPAYGGPGFLVLWITMYLFISASGGINECVVSFLLFKDKKALLAPFMIFYIVINISPTFAPFVLSPGFYRYGYAMPMFNAYEALKVLFFDTWRGSLGRNYAILAAWVVASNTALVGILKWISTTSKKALAEKPTTEKEHSSQSS